MSQNSTVIWRRSGADGRGSLAELTARGEAVSSRSQQPPYVTDGDNAEGLEILGDQLA
jgi:hypothetical protein